jgi:small subunit ribosomal protein S12
VKILHPNKPNSGRRQCARVILKNKKVITAYIPGIQHNLQDYSSVLIKGGGAKDLTGVKFSVVRGSRDAQGVKDRKQGRSIYGTKKQN